MKLSEISFPVYVLGDHRPIEEDGVSFYLTQNNTIDIVDDKSIEGNTLGERRVKIRSLGANLYKISKAIFFISDLIKEAKPSTWFVGSDGKIFQYHKSVKVPLVCKKITRVIRGTGCYLICVEGLQNRFMVLYPPTEDQRYSALLKIGASYIFYGFSKSMFKNTHRKI